MISFDIYKNWSIGKRLFLNRNNSARFLLAIKGTLPNMLLLRCKVVIKLYKVTQSSEKLLYFNLRHKLYKF